MNNRRTASEVRYSMELQEKSFQSLVGVILENNRKLMKPILTKIGKKIMKLRGNAHDRRKEYRKRISQYNFFFQSR